MKMIAWFVTASVLVVASSSRAQDTKSDSKFFIDVLDKVYGIKTKSIVVTDVKPPPPSPIPIADVKPEAKTRITITLSFSRDVKTPNELQLLLATFTTGTPYRFDAQPLVFHFFDEDNVCIDSHLLGDRRRCEWD